jgi:hypothetical protein
LDDAATGLERAVFGDIGREQIDVWLASHVWARLSAEVSTVLFRSGRVGAVYGLQLSDGHDVVVKVHRKPVVLEHLSAATACQRVLADAGYPCPSPLDGPAVTAGHTATIEAWLEGGEPGNAHQPAIRKTMAKSLAMQPEILREMPSVILATHPPAWASYAGGPWPTPHDSIFDFSKSEPSYQWLDASASEAASMLGPPTAPEVIGHSDWVCQNLRFAHVEVVASYDWDSLIGQSEPGLAGFGGGSYTEGQHRRGGCSHARGSGGLLGRLPRLSRAAVYVGTTGCRCRGRRLGVRLQRPLRGMSGGPRLRSGRWLRAPDA